MMTDETLEALHERHMEMLRRLREAEPLDDDTVELLKEELSTTLGKANRLCNLLLNRNGGLGVGVIDALDNIKLELSRVRWYLDQRDKLLLRRYATDIRELAEACSEAGGPPGDAARRLLEVLPLDA